MEDRSVDPDQVIKGAVSFAVAASAILFGPAFFLGIWIWRHPASVRRQVTRLPLAAVGLAVPAILVWWMWLSSDPVYRIALLPYPSPLYVPWMGLARLAVLCWWGGTAGVLALSPAAVLFNKKQDKAIRAQDFHFRIRHFGALRAAFENPAHAPIGINLRSGKVVSLFEKRRCSHVLVLGATGTGKTTLLTNLVLHAIRHGKPCVVIDPKIETDTVHLIRKQGKLLASDFDRRFRHFNISSPFESAHYNPLKHGSAGQLKDRILEALNWTEEYYFSISADFLTDFTACAEYLKLPLSLDFLSRVVGRREVQADFLSRLRELAMKGDEIGEALFERLSLMLSKLEKADIRGLQAQLSVLNNPTLGRLLSFEKSENEIDLRRVLANDEIAYFQLDTLGNADTSRRLGRMIFEDLKGLASHIYGTTTDADRKFLPLFVDEFGGLTSKEFIEGLKQVRGARIGMHLFSQGLEDLDAIGETFRRQVSANPMTKILLRLDDAKAVNDVCAMAGTQDATEQSHQTEGVFSPTKTGLGNSRETKQMIIEHDVLKNLEIGQAVVMEKSPSRVHAIEMFQPEILFPVAGPAAKAPASRNAFDA